MLVGGRGPRKSAGTGRQIRPSDRGGVLRRAACRSATPVDADRSVRAKLEDEAREHRRCPVAACPSEVVDGPRASRPVEEPGRIAASSQPLRLEQAPPRGSKVPWPVTTLHRADKDGAIRTGKEPALDGPRLSCTVTMRREPSGSAAPPEQRATGRVPDARDQGHHRSLPAAPRPVRARPKPLGVLGRSHPCRGCSSRRRIG